MKSIIKTALTFSIAFLTATSAIYAQKSIKEFVDKTGKEKIKKSIGMGPGCVPVTAGGFKDGHGRNPVLISKKQIPDTIALITFYINDIGTESRIKNISTTYYSLSEKGGNIVANDIYNTTIDRLKAKYRELGIVLLTPNEFLDTPEKKNFYYNKFVPEVSKLGTFLSGMETKQVDIAATADYFRHFDVSAAGDHLRAESLGSELAKKLEVNGVLSIMIEIRSDGKNIFMNGLKMFLNGPNPIPKEDKKYVAQNMGNGYYHGQVYATGTFYFKKEIPVGKMVKGKIENLNFMGSEIIFEAFAEKFQNEMLLAIDKASKKYSK
jgi:hypothetical protein